MFGGGIVGSGSSGGVDGGSGFGAAADAVLGVPVTPGVSCLKGGNIQPFLKQFVDVSPANAPRSSNIRNTNRRDTPRFIKRSTQQSVTSQLIHHS